MRKTRLRDVDRHNYDYMWGPVGTAYYLADKTSYEQLSGGRRRVSEHAWAIVLWRMEADGEVQERRIPVGRQGKTTGCSLMPSPDRKLAMVRCREHRDSKWLLSWLEFVDIENARNLDLVITDPKRSWWQSNTEVGYIDTEGKRQIVRVVE